MQSFHPVLIRPIRIFFLLAVLLVGTSGCQYIPSNISALLKKEPAVNESQSVNTKKGHKIREIYIQNFSGQKVKEVQEIFFEAAKEQSHFTFMELLPNKLEQLGVLRIDVIDYNIWEIDEKATDTSNSLSKSIDPEEPIKRINAIVSLKVNLYEAKSGKLLINRRFSQPFQQIYVGNEVIKNRPDNSLELDRLTKLLIFSMLESFLNMEEQAAVVSYENGLAYDWFAKKIHNFGNRRIRKGIRLALAEDLDEAIWVWKILLFAPKGEEPDKIYLHNRAATYYNLGIAYQMKKDWWAAAEMFSHANRIQQKLKYAQAWGNSIQLWLEEQRNPPPEMIATPVVKPEPKKVELAEKTEPLSAVSIEKNGQMLLKPRILWPLDPHLKKREQLQK